MSTVTDSSRGSRIDPFHESETSRLQKELEMFTQSFENEKRKLQILEDQIKQVEAEISEKKTNIQLIKPASLAEKKDNIKLQQDSNAIKNETLKLNDTKSKNQTLKREVNMLRKELCQSQNGYKKLQSMTKKMRKMAEAENREMLSNMRTAEEHINQSIALRFKHEEDKEHFEGEVKRYQDKLYGKEEEAKIDEEQSQNGGQTDKAKAGDFQNPIAILKLRLAKIVATNKEKKRLMDQYLRNVKVIEDAFDQIKEATGITAIDDIVTSFIKAEDQNYSLLNYVNRLTNETDLLEDSNREIQEQIQKISETKQLSDEQKEQLIHSMKDEIKFYEDEISKQ